tara:strand:+ start:8523 stop:8711 length:189 start_codon:yes stop_codon:yes gene_type:complete
MKSAKSYGFHSGQEKINQPISFRYVRGGKQTLVCYRTVHSSTVTIHLKTNTNHEENSWNFNF